MAAPGIQRAQIGDVRKGKTTLYFCLLCGASISTGSDNGTCSYSCPMDEISPESRPQNEVRVEIWETTSRLVEIREERK
jgi:hypothetical protein